MAVPWTSFATEGDMGEEGKFDLKRLPLGWAIVISTLIFTVGSCHQVSEARAAASIFVVNKMTGSTKFCTPDHCRSLKHKKRD